jgi:hypothetical protein
MNNELEIIQKEAEEAHLRILSHLSGSAEENRE